MQDINLQCETITGGQNCVIASGDPFVTPFISSGEILISLFLFIIIFLELVKLLIASISSVKVVREFTGNNSPDGKENYTI